MFRGTCDGFGCVLERGLCWVCRLLLLLLRGGVEGLDVSLGFWVLCVPGSVIGLDVLSAKLRLNLGLLRVWLWGSLLRGASG